MFVAGLGTVCYLYIPQYLGSRGPLSLPVLLSDKNNSGLLFILAAEQVRLLPAVRLDLGT